MMPLPEGPLSAELQLPLIQSTLLDTIITELP
jgi:hypothetical protein